MSSANSPCRIQAVTRRREVGWYSVLQTMEDDAQMQLLNRAFVLQSPCAGISLTSLPPSSAAFPPQPHCFCRVSLRTYMLPAVDALTLALYHERLDDFLVRNHFP